MNLQDYGKIITESDESDWNVITCWGGGSGPSFLYEFGVWTKGSGEFHNIEIDSHGMTAIFKPNLEISFAWGLTQNTDFHEDWANIFSDPKASSSFIDFFYCKSLVYRDVIVTVDGGRVDLPLPKLRFDEVDGEKIPRYQLSNEKVSFFRMLNSLSSTYNFDDYLNRTGIEIIETRWMT